METIGDIAAGGGGGGVGGSRGEEGDEEGRGLLTLLCEARAQLQVLLEHYMASPPNFLLLGNSRLSEEPVEAERNGN